MAQRGHFNVKLVGSNRDLRFIYSSFCIVKVLIRLVPDLWSALDLDLVCLIVFQSIMSGSPGLTTDI